MKHAVVLLTLTLFIVVAACRKSAPLNKEFILLKGDCRNVEGGDKVRICYDSLLQDSRCPVGMMCIWAGVAAGKFSFSVNSEEHILTLATANLAGYRKDTTVGNYHIELLEIAPYPGTHPPGPASAKVKVSKE